MGLLWLRGTWEKIEKIKINWMYVPKNTTQMIQKKVEQIKLKGSRGIGMVRFQWEKYRVSRKFDLTWRTWIWPRENCQKKMKKSSEIERVGNIWGKVNICTKNVTNVWRLKPRVDAMITEILRNERKSLKVQGMAGCQLTIGSLFTCYRVPGCLRAKHVRGKPAS